MESEKYFLTTETFVTGALLSTIYELEYTKDQKYERFAQEVAKEIERLLPRFHFAICEDCWDDVFLEDVLITCTVWIEDKEYLVAIFESGRLVCSKKDLKKNTGFMIYSQGVVEETEDTKIIRFARRPDLERENAFNEAFAKLKDSIPDFDGFMNLLKAKLSNETDVTLKQNVKVEKKENGITYTILSREK